MRISFKLGIFLSVAVVVEAGRVYNLACVTQTSLRLSTSVYNL